MPNLWETWAPETQAYYTENPSALYNFLFPQVNLQTGKGNWFRNQYDRQRTNYMAQGPEQPNTNFYSFLTGQNMEDDFRRLAPSQRGENPTTYAPRVQYRGRGF